jgi:hypothetical protein
MQAATKSLGIRIFEESRNRISYGYKCAMIPIQAQQQRHTNGFDKIGYNDCCGNNETELQLAEFFNLLDRTVRHESFVWSPCCSISWTCEIAVRIACIATSRQYIIFAKH